MSLRATTLIALFGLAAATGCGKGAGGGCATAGVCGGDPIGTWQVEPALTCSFPVYNKPAQNAAPPETGVPPPAATSGSWCWDLIFDNTGAVTSQNGQAIDTIATVALLNPNPDIVTSGTITFSPDHTYVYLLDAQGTTTFQLARACLGVNGANFTCNDLAGHLMTAVDPTKYSNFTCKPSSGGCDCSRPGNVCPETPARACAPASDGCDCSFEYSEPGMVGDQGRWVVQGTQIIHYSVTGGGNLFQTPRTVRSADFCVSNNDQTLELSGSDGTALALKPGLRTLTLSKVTATADAGADTASVGTGPVDAAVVDAAVVDTTGADTN